jgi:hypothetical protein
MEKLTVRRITVVEHDDPDHGIQKGDNVVELSDGRVMMMRVAERTRDDVAALVREGKLVPIESSRVSKEMNGVREAIADYRRRQN